MTPLPPRTTLAAILQNDRLMRALLVYDRVGIQSRLDRDHFADHVQLRTGGERQGEDGCYAYRSAVRARDFPTGIDVDELKALCRGADARVTCQTMRERYTSRRLLVGLDRLDCSKGLPQRIRAFCRLLERHPENHRNATPCGHRSAPMR